MSSLVETLVSLFRPGRAVHASPGFVFWGALRRINNTVRKELEPAFHCLIEKKSLDLQELGTFLAIVIFDIFC